MNAIRTFLVFTLSISAGAVLAQESYGGMNINIFNTIGEFEKNVPETPTGIGFQSVFSLTERISVGGEIGVAMYAKEEYMQDIVHEGEIIPMELYEEDCFFTYNAFVRVHPFDFDIVQPYGEFRAGGTSFFSTIMALDDPDYIYESETDFVGTSFNTGVGGGLVIKFGSYANFGLDLGATYMLGTRTNYRNMALDDAYVGNLDKGRLSSKTNNVNWRAGFLMFF